MSTPVEVSVERFLRRMEGTDEATLRRNLRAGVYGPPGSPRRAVVELAVESRLAARAEAIAAATHHEHEALRARVDRVETVARRTLWAALLALLAASVALLRG